MKIIVALLILAFLPGTNPKSDIGPVNDPMALTCPNRNSLSSLSQTITSEIWQETCPPGTPTIKSQQDGENVTRQGHTATSMPGPIHDRIPEVPATVTETNHFAPDVVTVLFH